MASDLSQFLRDEPQITSLFMKSTKIGGIPITNQNDNLVLGDDGQYSTVNAFNMNLGGQIVANIAIINDGINTSNIEPNTGSGGVVNIDGYVSVNNYGINNVDTLTLKNANLGSAGQVLGLDSNQHLTWLTNGGGSVGNLNDVLINGNDGGQNSITNVNNVQATSFSNIDNSFTVSNKGSLSANDATIDGDVSANRTLTNQVVLSNAGLIIDATSSYGSSGQILSSLGTNGTQWIDQGVSNIPTLNEVLTQSNDANNKTIVNLGAINTAGDPFVVSSAGNLVANAFNNQDNSFYVTTNGGVQASSISTNQMFVGNLAQNTINPTFYLNTQGVIYGSVLGADVKLKNIYYVSSTGSDYFKDGSINAPYQTIAQVLSVTEPLTASDGQFRYIFLAGGTYAENVTITQPVAIIGQSQGSNSAVEGCYIQGNITLNMNNTTVSMNQNNIIISSLLINGSITNTTSTANSRLIMSNCYVYSNTCINYYPSFCTDGRIFLDNCIFTSTNTAGTTPLINIGLGMIKMSLCELTQFSNYPCLQFVNLGRVDKVALTTFESTTTSTTAQPIVYINTSATNSYAFGQCTFIYTSTANKSASAISSGICTNSTSGNPYVLAVQCFFSLAGTTNANYAIQDLQHGTALTSIVLFFGNSASLNNASSIQGNNNTTKFQLQTVS